METIFPILIQVITGIAGGQAVGAVFKQIDISQVSKLLSGAVGGLAGGSVIGGLLGTASGVDPATSSSLGGMLGDAIGGAGGGALLTVIVGMVTKAYKK